MAWPDTSTCPYPWTCGRGQAGVQAGARARGLAGISRELYIKGWTVWTLGQFQERQKIGVQTCARLGADMARLVHIKRRLDNWALWKARMNSNGIGYASRNVIAVWAEDVWSRTSYHGASIPHFDQDAEETDRAVQALKLGKGHLYVTLDCIYLKDLGVNGTARRMRRAVSTVHAQLEQADRFIDAWLMAERQAKDKARAQARAEEAATRNSFTS